MQTNPVLQAFLSVLVLSRLFNFVLGYEIDASFTLESHVQFDDIQGDVEPEGEPQQDGSGPASDYTWTPTPLCPPPGTSPPAEPIPIPSGSWGVTEVMECFTMPSSIFAPWPQSCDSGQTNAKCDLRTSTDFHGYTAYGPDYYQVDTANCVAMHGVWKESSEVWHRDLPVGTWDSGTDSYTTTSYDYSTSTFTSNGTAYGWLVPTLTSSFVQYRYHAYDRPTYPFTAPCTVTPDPVECASLQSMEQQRPPITARARTVWRDPERELMPGCTAGCDLCMVTARDVQILYWPVTTIPGHPESTLTKSEKGITVVAVHGSVTLTSPTVYVSFGGVDAFNNCGRVGKKYENAILSIPATEYITSLEGYAWHWVAETSSAFNYADLNQPIRADVYRKLIQCGLPSQGCYDPEVGRSSANSTCVCPVAVLNGYTPKIQYPEAVRTIDPEWRDCYLDVYGVVATPVPLTSTSILRQRPTPTPGLSPAMARGMPTAAPNRVGK